MRDSTRDPRAGARRLISHGEVGDNVTSMTFSRLIENLSLHFLRCVSKRACLLMLGSVFLGIAFGFACAGAFVSSGGSLPASFLVYASAGALGALIIASTGALVQVMNEREVGVGVR